MLPSPFCYPLDLPYLLSSTALPLRRHGRHEFV